MSDAPQAQLYWSAFVVDERPYCAWGWELPAENLRFLDGIDATYFNHIVESHSSALDSDQKQHAAMVIRLTYSQALETFFALLCSAIQAPACPLGWMITYDNRELVSVVRKIQEGHEVLTRLKGALDWGSLSTEIHKFQLEDKTEEQRIKRLFANSWESLARDFLDERSSAEYNSIKHGLRARPGGVSLYIDPVDKAPEEPPGSILRSESDFGSRFYRVRRLGDGINFYPVEAVRNWTPVSLSIRIEILSLSIGNVLSYLKIAGGTSNSTVQFNWPLASSPIDLAWKASFLMESGEGGYPVKVDDIRPMRKAEILSLYDPKPG